MCWRPDNKEADNELHGRVVVLVCNAVPNHDLGGNPAAAEFEIKTNKGFRCE